MAFGAGLWLGAQHAYSGVKAAYSNAKNGPDFNLESYMEARKKPCQLEPDCFEEDWTTIEKPGKKDRRASSSQSSSGDADADDDDPDDHDDHDHDDDDDDDDGDDDDDHDDDHHHHDDEYEDATMQFEPYMIQNTRNIQQLRLKATRTATRTASEAAEVSLTYVKWALRYAALEAAHDIGFLTNCKTATDAVHAVKARFPVLGDMQRAYHLGANSSPSLSSLQDRMLATRTFGPEAGIGHPYDVRVPSNLDDIPIIPTETARPLYDPDDRAEVELVFEPIVRRAQAASLKTLRQAHTQKKASISTDEERSTCKLDEDPCAATKAQKAEYDTNTKHLQLTPPDEESDDDDEDDISAEMMSVVHIREDHSPCQQPATPLAPVRSRPHVQVAAPSYYEDLDFSATSDPAAPIIGSLNDSEELMARAGLVEEARALASRHTGGVRLSD